MILFPTDLSEQSSIEFGFALAFAKKLNEEITLFHVYHMPILNPATVELGADAISEELIQATETSAENRLKQFKDDLSIRYASTYPEMVRVHGMIRMGLIADEILQAALEINASYIFLKIKHRNVLDRIIAGNTALHVINKSKVPVITVPEDFTFNGIRNIAYATDLTFSDNEILAQLLLLAKSYDATIKCFHVHDSKLEVENDIIKDFIEQYRTEANAGLISFQLIDNLNIADGIAYFVKENAIDILCVMKQKHYWLDVFEKNITKKLLLHEQIPMLIFHE